METLYIDCQSGLAGDMLLAAFFDLGVPKEVVTKPLEMLGLVDSYSLDIEEGLSYGLRGIRVDVELLEVSPPNRRWKDIKELIIKSSLEESLKIKILKVFEVLAKAEASVHGALVDEVHFHEIGSLDSLVDIVGVCSVIEYLKPKHILCSEPPMGSGTIRTEHGFLPVPVPAVLEIATKFNITLVGGNSYPKGELTTPTGLALMAVFVNNFEQPSSFCINSFGVGLGTRDIKRPNLLRVCDLSSSVTNISNDNEMTSHSIVCQESWIDDSTPEDISDLVDRLRKGGAIEVVTNSVYMKKGRQAVNVQVLVSHQKAIELRKIWFLFSTTIGLRERSEERWILQRREVTLSSSFGDVKIKEVKRPNGKYTFKIEHEELRRLSNETGKSIDQIRGQVLSEFKDLTPQGDWECH